MTENINREFLNTLLASNAIWAVVTFVVASVLALGARWWAKKRDAAHKVIEEAEWCRHCRICHGWVGGTGRKCLVSREVCGACRETLDHRPAEMRRKWR